MNYPDIAEIKRKIIKQYGNYKGCAEALGIKATQLSRWLKNPSEKFYLLLTNEGIIKGDEWENAQKEREYFMNEYRKIIEEQGKLLADQRVVIEQMKKIIEKKEKRRDEILPKKKDRK